jgi:hypothetical protein
MSKETQESKLMAYLEQGNEITMLEALTKFGIGNLKGRIFDLRRMGFPVITEMRNVRKANGENARIAFYKMGNKND